MGRCPTGASLSVLHGVGPDDLDAALASDARPVLNTPAQVARWKQAAPGRAVRRDGRHRNEPARRCAPTRSTCSTGSAIDTLMSHLACADEDHAMNAVQRDRFAAVAAAVPARRYSLANSRRHLPWPRLCLRPRAPGPRALRRDPARRGGRAHRAGRLPRGRSGPAPHGARRRNASAMARPGPRPPTPRRRSSTSVMPTAICAASPRTGCASVGGQDAAADRARVDGPRRARRQRRAGSRRGRWVDAGL